MATTKHPRRPDPRVKSKVKPGGFRPVKPRQPATAKAAVAKLVAAAGGAERTAVLTGVGLSTVYGWTDPASPDREISFARACQLTAATRDPAAVEFLASLIPALVLPLPGPGAGIKWHQDAEALAREAGEVIQRYFRFLADGVLDAAEARELLGELLELAAAVGAASAHLRQHLLDEGEGAA